MKRTKSFCTLASTVICVLLIFLLPLSLFLELPDFAADGETYKPNASISIGSIRCAAFGGSIWLFNSDVPYSGSIITLEGVWGRTPTNERVDWSWVINRYGVLQKSHIDKNGQSAGKARYIDFPGIYYRYFEWRDYKSTWWTFALNLCYPIAISAVMPCWWLIQGRRRNQTTVADT